MPGTRRQSRSAGAAAAARTGSPRCRRQTRHAPTTGRGPRATPEPTIRAWAPPSARSSRPRTTHHEPPAPGTPIPRRPAIRRGNLERRAPEAEAHPNCSHDSTRPLTRMTAANPPRTDHRPKAKPGIQAWALPTARSSRPETTHHDPPAPGTPTPRQPSAPPGAISNVARRRRSTLQQQPWQHAPAHQIGAGEPTTDRPQAKAKPPASGPKPGPRLTHADPRPLTTSLRLRHTDTASAEPLAGCDLERHVPKAKHTPAQGSRRGSTRRLTRMAAASPIDTGLPLPAHRPQAGRAVRRVRRRHAKRPKVSQAPAAAPSGSGGEELRQAGQQSVDVLCAVVGREADA
jgi:hypothetical protein